MENRIITKKHLRLLVPLSDTQIARLEKAGEFPKRIKLGLGRVGWVLNEIDEWIEARKDDREKVT